MKWQNVIMAARPLNLRHCSVNEDVGSWIQGRNDLILDQSSSLRNPTCPDDPPTQLPGFLHNKNISHRVPIVIKIVWLFFISMCSTLYLSLHMGGFSDENVDKFKIVVYKELFLIPVQYCEFCSNRILLYFPMSVCVLVSVSQAWHLKFSR